MILPKNLWPRRFGESLREGIRHGAVWAVGIAHILEQVAARPPRPVEAASITARGPRRVGAFGLVAQPRVFLDHPGHDGLNRGFQFALPIGLGNDTCLVWGNRCIGACLRIGLARCGARGFSRAIRVSATNA